MSGIPDRIIEVPPANSRSRTEDATDSDREETPRFDQERKEWAASLNEQVNAHLQDHFGVGENAILDLEGMFDAEYSTSDRGRILQWMDYAGVDKIVDDNGTRFLAIGQRLRPCQSDESQYERTDFSFRTENAIPTKGAEWDRCMTAHREGGLSPDVYAFGVVDDDEESFEEFHLIDAPSFLDAIEAGALHGQGPHKTDITGVKARYYAVDDLRETGCILRSWSGDSV